MSTLNVVEEILRERRVPMVVKEIVLAAGPRLPTKSRTPDTVVARDLAMDIKKKGEQSKFARVAPGKYTLREYAHQWLAQGSSPAIEPEQPQPTSLPPPSLSAELASGSISQ